MVSAALSLSLVVLCLTAGLSLVSAAFKCPDWGLDHCQLQDDGSVKLIVSEDKIGSMQSDKHYVQGFWSMDMKLPGGNSGGINIAWYAMDSTSQSNKDNDHAEIDIEFYGDTAPDKMLLALNVFAGGKQNLAQFRLPFDPSADFHNYAMRWNAKQIIWFVDNTPIRILDFDPDQPWPLHSMRGQTSIWPTPWTPLQPDWNANPEISNFVRNYKEGGCEFADNDFGTPGQQQCNGTWNNGLTAAQQVAYKQFHDKTFVVGWGWDNV